MPSRRSFVTLICALPLCLNSASAQTTRPQNNPAPFGQEKVETRPLRNKGAAGAAKTGSHQHGHSHGKETKTGHHHRH